MQLAWIRKPVVVRPSVGSVPFNRDSLSCQFRSVQALQPLLMETCKSRVIIKTCTKSWVRVGQFLGIHSMKWPLGCSWKIRKKASSSACRLRSEHWWKLLSLVSRPVPALCILVTLGESMDYRVAQGRQSFAARRYPIVTWNRHTPRLTNSS